MPGRGRGRGRGVQGLPSEQPVLSEKQRELLQSGKPPPPSDTTGNTVPGQFDDSATTDSEETNDSLPTITPSSTDGETLSPSQENGSDEKDSKIEQSSNEPITTTPTKTMTTPTQAKSPSKPLNVNAPVFVPKSLEQPTAVGGASLEFPPAAPLELTPEEVLNGFSHKSSGDVPLLLTAATMLLEASHYPATFDTHLSILCHLIDKTTPTSDVLDDLAEMLLFWGISSNDELRYTSIKMNDYFCKFSIKEAFRQILFTKLQSRFSAQKDEKYKAGDNMSELIDTTVYMAEMFHRVRLANDQVVWVLGSAVIVLVNKLLEICTNETIIKACNVIKLIGYLLNYKTPKQDNFNPVLQLELILATLRQLSVNPDISSHTSTVILSVMTLSGTRWGVGASPHAKPKMVVEPEAPVTNVEDWEQYVDDGGYVIEGEEYIEPTVFIGDQSDPNIDEDLMREYEEFVQDFEDHLMMQEFGQT